MDGINSRDRGRKKKMKRRRRRGEEGKRGLISDDKKIGVCYFNGIPQII